MLDFWLQLPAWLRVGTAMALIVVGTLLFFFVSVRAGLVSVVLGCVLLLIGGRSEGEKKGYRF